MRIHKRHLSNVVWRHMMSDFNARMARKPLSEKVAA